MTYSRNTLISKFTPLVPISSQFRLYILGEFVKNRTHRFQCFTANDVIIKRVYCCWSHATQMTSCATNTGGLLWRSEGHLVPRVSVLSLLHYCWETFHTFIALVVLWGSALSECFEASWCFRHSFLFLQGVELVLLMRIPSESILVVVI